MSSRNTVISGCLRDRDVPRRIPIGSAGAPIRLWGFLLPVVNPISIEHPAGEVTLVASDAGERDPNS
jgi:hypothetical protein